MSGLQPWIAVSDGIVKTLYTIIALLLSTLGKPQIDFDWRKITLSTRGISAECFCTKYLRIYRAFPVDFASQTWICLLADRTAGDSARRVRIKEDEVCIWPSRIGSLIHSNWKMMKTWSDKAVTNQSHCERWTTVKDISGQSSHASARRCRPVSANSHASRITQESSLLRLFFFFFFF